METSCAGTWRQGLCRGLLLSGLEVGSRVKKATKIMWGYTVEARKLEHHYPHALKVKYKGS